jgi:hypothetical protein
MTMLNGLGSKGVRESPTEGLVQLLTSKVEIDEFGDFFLWDAHLLKQWVSQGC